MNPYDLPTRDTDGNLLAVVETPRGAVAKIAFDPALGCFKLSRPLVLGVAYPYDWGFFPSTRAPDGDPLDVLIFHDAGTYPGVVIPCKAVGVVKLSQKAQRGRERNDRVIAVPVRESRVLEGLKLNDRLKKELEQFFLNVSAMEDKKVRIEGWDGAAEAETLVRKAQAAYAKM